jgi:hypothetical protein
MVHIAPQHSKCMECMQPLLELKTQHRVRPGPKVKKIYVRNKQLECLSLDDMIEAIWCLWWVQSSPPHLTVKGHRWRWGAQYLTGENLELVWAKFSNLRWFILLHCAVSAWSACSACSECTPCSHFLIWKLGQSSSRCQCYKTFLSVNLWIFVCGQGQEPTL